MWRKIIILLMLFFFHAVNCALNKSFVDKSFIFDSVLVDLRKELFRKSSIIPKSISFDVSSLDDPKSVHSSMLLPVGELQTILSNAGFNSQQRFLLIGNSTSGWGEEGRLYWILNQYFEINAKILDGGFKAYNSLGVSKIANQSRFSKNHPLKLKTTPGKYAVSLAELKTSQSPILDVRGVLEFSGATPFGSTYGGHIKRAKSVPWDQFFDGEGYLREKPLFMKSLTGKSPIVYCTAGYRSAMVWAVLKHYGINSKNYDGSWFEYSSQINE